MLQQLLIVLCIPSNPSPPALLYVNSTQEFEASDTDNVPLTDLLKAHLHGAIKL